MSHRHRLSLLALASAVLGGSAAAETHLSLSYVERGKGTQITAKLDGAAGDRFVLSMSATPDGAGEIFLGQGDLDANGSGTLTVPGPGQDLSGMFHFRAWFMDQGARTTSEWSTLGFGAICERLRFNWAKAEPFGSRKLDTGEIVDEQWANAGLHVSAQSATDTVIIFDSANPTGGDFDLQTPGYGPGNDEAWGNLLILAEDTVDADMDGLVDDPDDDEAGGIINLDFDQPVTMCSIGVVDMDDGGIGSTIRFLDAQDNTIDEILFPSVGDNSFQEVFFTVEDVSTVQIDLKSSGAIPFLSLLPCPSRIDFNTNTFGVPLGNDAGTIVTDLPPFLGIGVLVEVENNTGAPDAGIIFDTANPTGQDFDLATPGSGVGNDTGQGNVLIIAEDIVDTNGDDLVDDPDDEAAGGMIAVEYPIPVRVDSMTVLDIDAEEFAFVDFYDEEDNLITTVVLDALGNNSSQTITPRVNNVTRVELHLSSSGALSGIVVCPTDPTP